MNENDFYRGKSILVTGGVGSIGKKLVKEILKMDVKTLRVSIIMKLVSLIWETN
jgi:FlaA1/EpsC-like NDP-sugar epimerase